MLLTRRSLLPLAAWPATLHAGRWDRLLGSKRADPLIESAVFTDFLNPNLGLSRIAVYPFEALEAYSPPVPSFSQALYGALGSVARPEDLFQRGAYPWESRPAHLQPVAADERMAEIVEDGARHGWGLAVYGAVHAYYRKAGHGLLIEVSAKVVSCFAGELLWHGAKRADWVREFRAADCVALVARSFVADWVAADEVEGG